MFSTFTLAFGGKMASHHDEERQSLTENGVMSAPPPPIEPGDLLTLEEVVAWLRVPRSWIYERTRKGQIPHLKLGKYLRFRRNALIAWLASQEGVGGSPETDRPSEGLPGRAAQASGGARPGRGRREG